MADSTTHLNLIAVSQAAKEVTANALFDAMSPNALFGRNDDTTSALTWGYYGGKYRKADGSVLTVANATIALTDAATNYILETDGVVSKVTAAPGSWPGPLAGGATALYAVVCSGGAVTGYTDYRTPGQAEPGSAASSVSVADSGSYFASSDAEGVLQEIGATLATLTGAGDVDTDEVFTSDTGSTADSDPGNGMFKWNNATQASATALYVDNQTADGVSMTTFFAALPADGFINLAQEDDATKWQLWKWSGLPTAGTGYYKFTGLTLMASAGSIADNKSVAVSFKGLGGTSTAGRHAIPIMAAAMRPSTAGGCAALATIASAANQPDISTLDFDASTQEYAQFAIPMPKSWNEGTVTFKPIWSHAATTTNFGVVWNLQGLAVSNDDPIAQAYGTAQTSTDTGGTTDDLYTGPESSAITIAGSPAAEDVVFFRISRVTGDGSDTMAIDARLHGIILYVTTDAETDA